MINEDKLLSYTDKKRLRVNFGECGEYLRIPHLYYMQLKSYYDFINRTRKNKSKLETLFEKTFPIYSNNKNIQLEYISYSLGKCIFNPLECKVRGLTYSAPLKIKIRLNNDTKSIPGCDNNIDDNNNSGLESTVSEIYMLDIPLITGKGTFIINGTERVVVSQLHKSPGLYFEIDKARTSSVSKPFYTAKIIPLKGVWVDFEFDSKDCIFIRMDKKKKVYITTLLRALNIDRQDMLNIFLKKVKIYFKKQYIIIPSMTLAKIKKYNYLRTRKKYIRTSFNKIIGCIIANDIINIVTNKVIIKENTKIDNIVLDIIKINNIKIIYITEIDNEIFSLYIKNTLTADTIKTKTQALLEIHRILRPGEPATKESAKYTINNLFFNKEKYDLSRIGRIKINEKLNSNITKLILSRQDIVLIIKRLIDIKNDTDVVDDIDNLSNRRVRSIGEIMINIFKTSFTRMEKSIKEKLSATDNQNLRPQDIINTKLISTAIREFFCSSQLSQFMDQINPLSEITHKRRLSALGPGGLSRERAGFDVRDVHNTHYGRICPIETPEGPNIGLINSLTIYSRINRYGFIETPYFVVKQTDITDEIKYLTANDESNVVIAQAFSKIDTNTRLLIGNQNSCRFRNEFIVATHDRVKYMDISPKQIISISTSLIPFLEHNDANRALMGSNMQRQATPLLNPETPLIGTGIEKMIAMDVGTTLLAKRGGVVKNVDASRIIIKVNDNEFNSNETGIDIYNLIKYIRSNQNTCINQKPLIKPGERINKNDIIADGQSTDLGELALGQNMFIAFMSWNGYNFEDSIIISDTIIKHNKLTSIHIEELVCVVRDFKMGAEEITVDIPNINTQLIKNLDEFGIIKLGSHVKTGDIIVGKVTKKTEHQITPEERLLHAIFGEKALDVNDTSLKVPTGIIGAVIDIQIFNRYGMEKDKKTLELEDIKLQKDKKNYTYKLNILTYELINQIKKLIIKGDINLSVCSILDMDFDTYKKLKINNEKIKWQIYLIKMELNKFSIKYKKKIKQLENKYKNADDLPPGVVKIVKVSIAMKKQLQVGDKLSGRHGNKGVVSIIIPAVDMPYLKNGKSIDVILNPLGVPSRMNLGQVFETHLGWAVKELGEQIYLLSKNFDLNYNKIKDILIKIYNLKVENIDIKNFSKNRLRNFIKNLKHGIPIATPAFDGIKENDIKNMLSLANLPKTGKIALYDGRSGLKFDNDITIGYQYLMKLNHLIDDKMHARATGSYSLISQQPLGGKAQFGGQRFGEMEVWALEAYGAAYTLQEMLTVKSDDITGRTKIYKNIINGNYQMDPGIPEAFNVLSKEILSLGLNIELEYEEI